MQLNKVQIIVISILVVLVGILVYANLKTPQYKPEQLSDVGKEKAQVKDFDLQLYLISLHDSVNTETSNELRNLTNIVETDTTKLYPKLKLAMMYDSLGYSLASGYYYSLAARILNDETSWYKAGFRFYECAATTIDTPMQYFATNKAIEAFEKVVAINSNNIEAKNALAICYIKNDLDIMKGVQLLKDVLRIDSTNIDANYTLGILSMRSGQMDKAAQRFKTLTAIQPFNPEFYYYLGECYVELNNKTEAIKAFETFRQLVPDEGTKQAIQSTINNLKNNN
ncbi:MAG: tetratricopeptide repeat protein [Bacteroidia bacterium]